MKRVIPIIVVVLVVVSFFVYRHYNRPAEHSDQLVLSGNIEAHESVVGFRTQGRIIELPIEEGQSVKRGDLLARLEDTDYRQQVHLDEATLHTREAELRFAEAGGRAQDVKASEDALADAKADLELKRIDNDRYQQLYSKDAVSAQQRDSAETAYKRAQAVFSRAQQNLSAIREGNRPEQIAVNRAAVRVAAQNLELSKVKLGFTVLNAPASGVILVRQAELGEIAQAGTPVVTIADLDHLWVRVYLSETDLGKLHLGQEVSIHADTFPNKQYKGRVSFISSQAEFTPKSVETHKERVSLVYRVKVDVENPNHELKPGMPADVTVQPIK